MTTVIKARHVSKKYLIHHQEYERYMALRDVMMNGLKGMGNRILKPGQRKKESTEEFWALKDISFEVNQGERLGIIGRNGAGKSTLLKLLSRITEPSEGLIRLKGRVASLLEVGTGFHPELTGRENIFLNGSILGMGKSEISNKFDEIVDFSGVENFLDTPVKRYSSGMQARLGFAVAAHLEPDILVVDEVLAVGDAGFQKKCMGKMSDIAREGRTVLFVSHNMPAIENLCSRVILLHEGEVVADTTSAESLSIYFSRIMSPPKCLLSERTDRSGSGDIKIKSFQILDPNEEVLDSVRTGQDIIFRFEYESNIHAVNELDFAFTVRHSFDSILFRNRTVESGIDIPTPFPEKGYLDCRIKNFPLTQGTYNFGFRLVIDGVESDYITGAYAAQFVVEEGDYFNTGKVTSFAPVLVDHKWNITPAKGV
ncbi:MAG: ABC transporter ATP-binding protein [Gammaproteobacteria bacterium]|nr:ABC transporter ATP-binding protein [Gammaproteobacteria bacterium]